MAIKSIHIRHAGYGFMAGLLLAASSASAASDDPEARIIMFGAHWCVPCRVEIGQLADLAAAAYPVRLELAWLDSRPRIAADLVEAVPTLEPSVARRLAGKFGGDGYGLPFSVMLDNAGRTCALRRGPATPQRIADMKRSCGIAPTRPERSN